MENIENDLINENIINENETNTNIQENIAIENSISDLQYEKLNQIHEDLGVICSFLIAFVLVILLHYSYKFFNMFFKI